MMPDFLSQTAQTNSALLHFSVLLFDNSNDITLWSTTEQSTPSYVLFSIPIQKVTGKLL